MDKGDSKTRLSTPLPWLTIALLAPFLPLLIAPQGRVLGSPYGDGPAAFYEYHYFAGKCWRQGVAPLWNPHITLGMPFLGEGQASVFHPLSMPGILLPTGAAINWLVALGFTLAGLFFYGWLRALRLGRGAAGCGALAWSFSSAMIPRLYAGHLSFFLVVVEMPLIMMLWERWRERGKTGYLLGIAPAYGAMILGAHPQYLYIFSLFFLFYVLVGGAATVKYGMRNEECGIAASSNFKEPVSNELAGMVRLGAFIALGVGLGAVQLLPSADFMAESFRRAATLEYCAAYAWPPLAWPALIVPRFFGFAAEPGPGGYWGPCNFWELSLYVGILPLLLAPAGVAAAPGRRRAALAGGAALFFLVALGSRTPLFRVLYKLIPFFDLFRGPARHLVVTHFCLATLGAYGLERLLHPRGGKVERRGWTASFVLAGVLLAGVVFAHAWYLHGHVGPGSRWWSLHAQAYRENAAVAKLTPETAQETAHWAARELARAAALIVLGTGMIGFAIRRPQNKFVLPGIAILILADLMLYFMPLMAVYDEESTRSPEERVAPFKHYVYPARVLDPDATENVTMLSGLSSPSGYVSNTLARYNRFINRIQGLDPATPQTHNQVKSYPPLIRTMAPDAVFLPERALKAGMRVLARGPGWILAWLPEALPRAFLATAPRRVGSEEEAMAHVLEPTTGLRERPAIEAGALGTTSAPPSPGEGVRIVSFTPNRVELVARAERQRVLVLCEAFEKNWRARVNGAAAPVYPANVIFRAVEVPAGASRIVFEYRPAAFQAGAGISLGSLALAGALTFLLWKRRAATIK